MAEFKVGDRVWVDMGGRVRRAAVILDIDADSISIRVRRCKPNGAVGSDITEAGFLMPRTEHIPELDGPAQPQRGEGAG